MDKEVIEALASAGPSVLKWAAFWHGFWDAVPLILITLLVTWGIRTWWAHTGTDT